MAFRLNKKKFRELILYVANMSRNDPDFGAVKLNKILYYADFRAYRELGRPISGAAYRKLPEGPAPRQLLRVQHELLADGAIVIEERLRFGHTQRRIVPSRSFTQDVLSDAELRIIDDAISDLRHMNARQVSDKSHREPGWRIVDDGESIPYRTAWLSPEPLTAKQMAQGLAVAKKHGLV